MLIFKKKNKNKKNFKKKKNLKQLSFKTKIIISKIRPRATFIQPKEAKNPPKISLLLQAKPSKSISKIPREFSTKQKKKKLSFLRDFQITKELSFLLCSKSVQIFYVALVLVSRNGNGSGSDRVFLYPNPTRGSRPVAQTRSVY